MPLSFALNSGDALNNFVPESLSIEVTNEAAAAAVVDATQFPTGFTTTDLPATIEPGEFKLVTVDYDGSDISYFYPSGYATLPFAYHVTDDSEDAIAPFDMPIVVPAPGVNFTDFTDPCIANPTGDPIDSAYYGLGYDNFVTPYVDQWYVLADADGSLYDVTGDYTDGDSDASRHWRAAGVPSGTYSMVAIAGEADGPYAGNTFEATNPLTIVGATLEPGLALSGFGRRLIGCGYSIVL